MCAKSPNTSTSLPIKRAPALISSPYISFFVFRNVFDATAFNLYVAGQRKRCAHESHHRHTSG